MQQRRENRLCVDDFGVKHCSDTEADNILNIPLKYYKISMDLEGKNYCGLAIEWNYDKKYVNISMPTYILKSLKRLLHHAPN